MKKVFLYLLLFLCVKSFSQPITVSTTAYSVPQLINNILINSACNTASNITWRTGTNFGSSNGIGYFQNTNPNFPIQSGVILSTGNVLDAPGPNNTIQDAGNITPLWTGDTSLEATLAASGITMSSTNATVVEFNFTPLSSHFDFDFLFASEEYGNFQCQFSDSFAFLLTNTVTGVTTNLAVVPGTTTPISVVTVRNSLYNSSCPSINPSYFGSFNGSGNAAGSATNFNGQTVVMNAAALLTPNIPYTIKLVIADRSDYKSDSAIFLSANSFNIGQDVLGEDLTIANNTAVCFGQTTTLLTGLNAAQYTFVWKKDGVVIAGETGPNLIVSQPGIYEVTYSNIAIPCQTYTDSIKVEFSPTFTTNNPRDLYKCNIGAASYTYNLASNTAVINLGVNPPLVVSYHISQSNANNNLSPLPATYTATSFPTTIWVRIKSPTSGCFVVKSFDLLLTPFPVAFPVTDYTVCSESVIANFTLNTLNPQILNGQSIAIYSVSYYATQANAIAGTSPLPNSYNSSGTTIWAVVKVGGTGATCISTPTPINLIVIAQPLVDSIETVITCTDYTLLPLTNGNYFTGDNGTGTPLFAGDIITSTQTIYIYSNPNGTATCAGNSFFKVIILKISDLDIAAGTYCDFYHLPLLEPGQGEYHTAPNGGGNIIPSDTDITTSQTIYYYFNDPGICVLDPPGFGVIILHPPNYSTVADSFFDCAQVTLPALPFGDYYNQPIDPLVGPTGLETIYPAGTTFNITQTIYAYGISGTCPYTKPINVVIGTASFPQTISQCTAFTLPNLLTGNYYTLPLGGGTLLHVGDVITTNQTIYVYAQSQTLPNCSDGYSFNVSITLPPIVPPTNLIGCGNFTLPTLPITNPQLKYFTLSGGLGQELSGGTILSTTQTVYIYVTNALGTCSDEKPIDIIVNPKPAIGVQANHLECNNTSYTLPPLTVGDYYTGLGGTGTIIPPGTVITTDTTLYVYAIDTTVTPSCPAENELIIEFITLNVDVPPSDPLTPSTISRCDSYTLPFLTVGNYHTGIGGTGTIIPSGTVITSTTTLYTYIELTHTASNPCFSESPAITINIINSPDVLPFTNVNACGSYTLPALAIGDYYTGQNKGGTIHHAGDVITTSQTLYVYAETGTTPNCFDEEALNITIFNVDTFQNEIRCDSENFTVPALAVGNFYHGINGTGGQIATGTVLTTTQDIYVYGTSPFAPFCPDENGPYTITIVPTPTVHSVPIADRTFCDDDAINDGVYNIDLTQFNTTILGTQTATQFTVKYYEKNTDAIDQTNAIISSNVTPIYVRVNNTLTPNCFDIKPITIIINKIPEPKPKDGIICFDSETNTLLNPYLIDSELSPSTHTFQWFDPQGVIVGNGNTYTAILPGVYSIIATENATLCPSKEIFVTVTPSEPAVVTSVQNDEFSTNSIVTVIATGTGDYVYLLDDGIYQTSNVFENVPNGIHIITVKDENGCGITTIEVLVIGYPKYFTPNGDNINDTWNIVDLKDHAIDNIFIYDRMGKLITQIYTSGIGWDGMYNNTVLPADDYWFVLNYTKNGVEKTFKSHFALKR